MKNMCCMVVIHPAGNDPIVPVDCFARFLLFTGIRNLQLSRTRASERNLQRLLVAYSPPLSDGGQEITSYWVELDPTPTFDDPITEEFRCPNSPDYATWVVETSSADATNSIVDG